jgi:hypothetical protein
VGSLGWALGTHPVVAVEVTQSDVTSELAQFCNGHSTLSRRVCVRGAGGRARRTFRIWGGGPG